MIFNQYDAMIRCEWALQGIDTLLEGTDVFIIVDVLSFSTCVDIAVSRGAVVYPYSGPGDSAQTFADSHGALLASHQRGTGGYSLSPTSLTAIPSETRLILPSPNGSRLSLATQQVSTFAGCLRNAKAVAHMAASIGSRISVIPAGERWPDGSLRVSLEDLIGAGAIIHHLPGTRSAEAQMVETAFLQMQPTLAAQLGACASARELVAKGFPGDVELALALNHSTSAPRLIDGAYQQSAQP